MKKEVELRLLKLSPELFKDMGNERFEDILSKEKDGHFYHQNDSEIYAPFLISTEGVFKGDEHLNKNNQIELYEGEKGILSDKIIAYPHQIGMKYDIEYETLKNKDLRKIEKWEIDEIVDLGGICNIEMMDEFSHPHLFHNVPLFEGVPEPFIINNKVIILK